MMNYPKRPRNVMSLRVSSRGSLRWSRLLLRLPEGDVTVNSRRGTMPHITLTEEQVRLLSAASGPVEVRDTDGRPVARLTPLDPAEAESIIRSRERLARGGPRVPSAEVQAHLLKLEEISQREQLDEQRVLELLRKMRAGEAV
jgi:hypothetical protein